MEYPNLEQDFQTIPDSIIRSIATRLTDCLEKCGPLTTGCLPEPKPPPPPVPSSRAKNYQDGKRMQDLFGIRVAVYFQDDQALCRRIIEDRFSVVSITEDRPDADTFSPTRLELYLQAAHELPSGAARGHS